MHPSLTRVLQGTAPGAACVQVLSYSGVWLVLGLEAVFGRQLPIAMASDRFALSTFLGSVRRRLRTLACWRKR